MTNDQFLALAVMWFGVALTLAFILDSLKDIVRVLVGIRALIETVSSQSLDQPHK